jgi:hypothetical protein
MEGTMPEPPRLLQRVRETFRARRSSPGTEKAYVTWIKRYIFFHDKRHPKDMREDEVRQFLTHLVDKQKVAPSTQNQARPSAPCSFSIGRFSV